MSFQTCSKDFLNSVEDNILKNCFVHIMSQWGQVIDFLWTRDIFQNNLFCIPQKKVV